VNGERVCHAWLSPFSTKARRSPPSKAFAKMRPCIRCKLASWTVTACSAVTAHRAKFVRQSG
jgi:hypothetical protein